MCTTYISQSMPTQLARLKASEHCLATWPPCCAIGMRIYSSGERHLDQTECVVYNVDGVRIGDLVAVANILLRQYGVSEETRKFESRFEVDGRLAW